MVVRHGSVISERTALSAAGATKTGHFDVKVEVRAGGSGQLIGVRCHGQFLLTVGQGRGRHETVSDEGNALSALVGERTPADFFAVALCLRFGQHDALLSHGALVKFDELTCLAVIVVVDGTATVVVVLAEGGGQFHGVAQTRQQDVGTVGRNRALEFDASVGIDGIDLVRCELQVILA